MTRAKLDVEDLLRIILLLLVVYLLIKVVEAVLGLAFGLVGFLLDPAVAVIVVVLILLWYFDYL